MIYHINKYAINDGPGIRLTIFLKGCPLKCLWCHNPESQYPGVQKLYNISKCISCGECVQACQKEACILTSRGIVTDPRRCDSCGKCAEACPTRAIEMSGRHYSMAELMTLIEKERVFFDQSGGGVTVSGGEPLMFPEYLAEILDAFGKAHIHRAVDTSGYAPAEVIRAFAHRTELFLYDLKIMDPQKHLYYTGVDNTLILENLRLLSVLGAGINIRLPLIRGMNDDDTNIAQSAAFIASLDGDKKQVSILPYHNIARKKYEKLGLSFDGENFAEPSEADLLRILSIFKDHGIEAVTGG